MNEKIKIDKEFSALTPVISRAELEELEKSIKAEGCRDPIVIYKGAILDGHNRFKICTAHKIAFETIKVKLKNRSEAKIWIIRNQFARRNLNNYQKSLLAFKLEPLIKAEAKKKQATHTKQGYQKSDKAVHTLDEMANIAGVSRDTIHKVQRIESEANGVLKDDLLVGRRSVGQVYHHLREKQFERARKIRQEQPKPFAEFIDKMAIKIRYLKNDFLFLNENFDAFFMRPKKQRRGKWIDGYFDFEETGREVFLSELKALLHSIEYFRLGKKPTKKDKVEWPKWIAEQAKKPKAEAEIVEGELLGTETIKKTSPKRLKSSDRR